MLRANDKLKDRILVMDSGAVWRNPFIERYNAMGVGTFTEAVLSLNKDDISIIVTDFVDIERKTSLETFVDFIRSEESYIPLVGHVHPNQDHYITAIRRAMELKFDGLVFKYLDNTNNGLSSFHNMLAIIDELLGSLQKYRGDMKVMFPPEKPKKEILPFFLPYIPKVPWHTYYGRVY